MRGVTPTAARAAIGVSATTRGRGTELHRSLLEERSGFAMSGHDVADKVNVIIRPQEQQVETDDDNGKDKDKDNVLTGCWLFH